MTFRDTKSGSKEAVSKLHIEFGIIPKPPEGAQENSQDERSEPLVKKGAEGALKGRKICLSPLSPFQGS